MIVDRLAHLGRYASLHPALPAIITFLSECDPTMLPTGQIPVTDEVVLIRESYLTKPRADCTFEGHERHADLQIVLSGIESMGWISRENCQPTITLPYSEDKDVTKFAVSEFSRIDLPAGTFALVFPDDLHMPKLMKEETVRVEKAVFKLPLQEVSPWRKS